MINDKMGVGGRHTVQYLWSYPASCICVHTSCREWKMHLSWRGLISLDTSSSNIITIRKHYDFAIGQQEEFFYNVSVVSVHFKLVVCGKMFPWLFMCIVVSHDAMVRMILFYFFLFWCQANSLIVFSSCICRPLVVFKQGFRSRRYW